LAISFSLIVAGIATIGLSAGRDFIDTTIATCETMAAATQQFYLVAGLGIRRYLL
jgi:hypothetical protein